MIPSLLRALDEALNALYLWYRRNRSAFWVGIYLLIFVVPLSLDTFTMIADMNHTSIFLMSWAALFG